MYLVRGGDGKMRTIMAFSTKGAVKIYLENYPARKGDILSVKLRGQGDWEEYDIR